MFKSRHGFIDPTLLLALAGLVTAIIGTTVATNINQQNSELRSQASVRCTDLSVKNCGGCSPAGYQCKVINNACRTSENRCDGYVRPTTPPDAGCTAVTNQGPCLSFCAGGYQCKWVNNACIKSESLCPTPTPKPIIPLPVTTAPTFTQSIPCPVETGDFYCRASCLSGDSSAPFNCSSGLCCQKNTPTITPRPSFTPTRQPTTPPSQCLDPCRTNSECGAGSYCYRPSTGCPVCKPQPTPNTSCLSHTGHDCIPTSLTCRYGTPKLNLSCPLGFICFDRPSSCYAPTTAPLNPISPPTRERLTLNVSCNRISSSTYRLNFSWNSVQSPAEYDLYKNGGYHDSSYGTNYQQDFSFIDLQSYQVNYYVKAIDSGRVITTSNTVRPSCPPPPTNTQPKPSATSVPISTPTPSSAPVTSTPARTITPIFATDCDNIKNFNKQYCKILAPDIPDGNFFDNSFTECIDGNTTRYCCTNNSSPKSVSVNNGHIWTCDSSKYNSPQPSINITPIKITSCNQLIGNFNEDFCRKLDTREAGNYFDNSLTKCDDSGTTRYCCANSTIPQRVSVDDGQAWTCDPNRYSTPTTTPTPVSQTQRTSLNTNPPPNTTVETATKVSGEFCGLSCSTTCISGRGTILGNLFCAPSTCDPLQPFMCQANTLYHCNFIPKTEQFDWVRQRPCTQGCDSNGNRCLDDESSPTLIPSSKSL